MRFAIDVHSRHHFFVIAFVAFELLADLVDPAQRCCAPRLHLDAEHHALRPHGCWPGKYSDQ